MQFDEQFLEEMGLSSMPAERKTEFLAYIQDELEVRIGEQISEGVAEERLEEFDAVETPEAAAEWLEENRPDFRDVVNRTIEAMKTEIRANRERLLGGDAATSESKAPLEGAASPEAEIVAENATEGAVAEELAVKEAITEESAVEEAITEESTAQMTPETPYAPPEADLDLLEPMEQGSELGQGLDHSQNQDSGQGLGQNLGPEQRQAV